MTKVRVLYYSAYGHIETMAQAVAECAREGGGVSGAGKLSCIGRCEVALG